MAKGNSLNRKEMIKEDTFELQKGKNIRMGKSWGNIIINYLSCHEFLKSYLMIGAKIILSSNVKLNVCRGNT